MPDGQRPAALVSVHDLMPETLDAVLATLRALEGLRVWPVTLLVVPGRAWHGRQLRVLRGLQASGYRLAGHGWRHGVDGVRGWRHRLHSALLSRRVAEHLALDGHGIVALIDRCFRWFGDHDLDPPQLYVPPAWALGRISRQRLEGLPFDLFETFSGIYDAAAVRFARVPLLGYEADTPVRVPPLRLWNGINRLAARRARYVRVAIHPFDLQQRLAGSLEGHLAQYRRFESYTGFAAALSGGSGLRPASRNAGRDAAPGRS